METTIFLNEKVTTKKNKQYYYSKIATILLIIISAILLVSSFFPIYSFSFGYFDIVSLSLIEFMFDDSVAFIVFGVLLLGMIWGLTSSIILFLKTKVQKTRFILFSKITNLMFAVIYTLFHLLAYLRNVYYYEYFYNYLPVILPLLYLFIAIFYFIKSKPIKK